MALPWGAVSARDTTDVNRLFDYRTTYQKGAMVLHQLRWLIGDEAFFSAIRLYLADSRLAYGFAVQKDLKDYFEAQSGMDLSDYFNDWITGEGYPQYTVQWQQRGNRLELDVQQSTTHFSVNRFNVPLPFLVKGNGHDTLLRIDIGAQDQVYSIALGFKVNEVQFDPEEWVLAKSTMRFPAANGDAFILYPNPFDARVYITAASDAVYGWKIYDPLGRLVLEDLFPGGRDPGSIIEADVSSLANGTYYLLIKTTDSEIVRLMFKQ